MKTTRTESPAIVSARAAVAAADSAIERFALATSRPHRVVTAEVAAMDAKRSEELLARAAVADDALRAALAADAIARADAFLAATA